MVLAGTEEFECVFGVGCLGWGEQEEMSMCYKNKERMIKQSLPLDKSNLKSVEIGENKRAGSA